MEHNVAKYRHNLPQVGSRPFLTDGGMETTLIFQEGADLPHFASFVLLDTPEGRAMLRRYHERYLAIARERGAGFVLDSATWRANADWGAMLGYDADALDRVNRDAIAHMLDLRSDWEVPQTPCVISGAIGPRGDGYKSGSMSASEARGYHSAQIATFAGTMADMVSAFTLTSVDEATGIALAARDHAMPCVISFTVETNGRLVTDRTLREAIEAVDDATGGYPAYFMINCAHPTHFAQALETDDSWTKRIVGLRANASAKSHAELDETETLDAGDPADLGLRYRALTKALPHIRVLGGCCGTDHRHVAAICDACLPKPMPMPMSA
jgi:homocysteine S-methyltransferase